MIILTIIDNNNDDQYLITVMIIMTIINNTNHDYNDISYTVKVQYKNLN